LSATKTTSMLARTSAMARIDISFAGLFGLQKNEPLQAA
jgi:hypothetical protein